jgi:hypothetical protein
MAAAAAAAAMVVAVAAMEIGAAIATIRTTIDRRTAAVAAGTATIDATIDSKYSRARARVAQFLSRTQLFLLSGAGNGGAVGGG